MTITLTEAGKDASKLPAALQHAKAVVEGWLRA